MSITINQGDLDLAASNYTTIFIDDVEASAGQNVSNGQVFKIVNDTAPFVDSGTYYSYRRDFANQKEYFDYNADKTEGTFTVNSRINSGGLVLEVDLETFDVTTSLLDQVANNNLTMYHNGTLIETAQTIAGGVIEFKASEGFMFAEPGNVVRLSNFAGYRDLNISEDFKTATTPLDHGFVSFTFNVVVDDSEQGVDVVGYNNLYLIDKDIYNAVQNDRFITTVDGDVEFDYGSYLLKTIQFPFTIGADFIGEEDFIRLATKSLDTKAPIITNDEIELDIGEVVIPEKYGDGRDYSNVTMTLYMPYNANVDLNIQQCMGATLHIKYVVNAYDGSAVAIITSNKTDETIMSNSFNLGFEIVVNQTQDIRTFGAISNNRSDNEVQTAYVEVQRMVPANADDIYTNLVPDFGTLENVTGYAIVDNMKITGNINYDEKQQLKSIVETGVYINA